MLILAFESTAKAASCALVRDGRLLSQYTQCSGLTHSRTLLPMGEDMLKNAIGVSMVKGLAWASDKACVGVSTLEAMAWHGLSAGGLICPVMDARRSQVYNALFRIEDGRPVRLTEDRPLALAELAEELRALHERAFLVGDGAELTQRALTERGIPCVLAPENLRMQSAWGVAMAAQDKTPGTADTLLPVYLRLSQAERERQARLKAEQA